MRPLRIALRHLLVQDAAAGGHPLHVAGTERTGVAEAVLVLDGSREHVGDGLDAAMRMPGEARPVVVRTVVAEVVEQQERIELCRIAEAEGAAQFHARSLHGRLRLDDVLHGSYGHGALSRLKLAQRPSQAARSMLSLALEAGDERCELVDEGLQERAGARRR